MTFGEQANRENPMITQLKERTNRDLEVLIQIARHAWGVYQIWWFIIGFPTRRDTLDTMNEYPAYFGAIEDALQTALLIDLCKLYDTDKKAVSIGKLLEIGQQCGVITGEEGTALVDRVLQQSAILGKLRLLRDKLLAHREKGMTAIKAFEQAQITPNQIRDFTKETVSILNRVMYISQRTTWHLDEQVGYDTRSLFDDLKRYHANERAFYGNDPRANRGRIKRTVVARCRR